MVTQIDIAHQVGLDVSSVNKILNKRQGPVFKKETVQKVFRAARQLGFKFERLKHRHARQQARKPVSITAKVSLHLENGDLFDTGEGLIHDLSPAGALLGIRLAKAALPVTPFTITLCFRTHSGAAEVEARGRIVRFQHGNGTPAFGVIFESAPPELSRHDGKRPADARK